MSREKNGKSNREKKRERNMKLIGQEQEINTKGNGKENERNRKGTGNRTVNGTGNGTRKNRERNE
jgi:hypothetical protein